MWPKLIFLHTLAEFCKNFVRVSFILKRTPALILRMENCSLIVGTQLWHALLNEVQRLFWFI